MEKRLVSFFVATTLVLVGFHMLQRAVIGPPQPRALVEAEEVRDGGREAGPDQIVPVDPGEPPGEVLEEQAAASPNETEDSDIEDSAEEEAAPRTSIPHQMTTLGSLDPTSGYRMLIYFSNRGGSIDRVELNSPQYLHLDDRSGYLGYLAAVDAAEGGCRVNVVGPGTPASRATSDTGLTGLRGPVIQDNEQGEATQLPGDRITAVNGTPVETSVEFHQQLIRTKPGDEIELTVFRPVEGDIETQHLFRAKLVRTPLAVISTEPRHPTELDNRHPTSYLLTLDRIGDARTKFKQDEIKGLPSLLTSNWSMASIPDGIEFRRKLSKADLEAVGESGRLEMVKRFRLPKFATDERGAGARGAGYVLDFEIHCVNLGDQPVRIGYQLDGPTGMTTEGWWYSYKVHPSRFVGAGARDVVWRAQGDKHELLTCSQITKHAKKANEEEENPDSPLFAASDPEAMRYIGCDTQYFAAVLQPGPDGDGALLRSAVARAVGPLDKRMKRTDVTYRIQSEAFELEAGETLDNTFQIFIGPKQDDILAEYGLQDCIVYGWFGSVSKPMLKLLHGLYWITGSLSYGIAIILLTVIVRACMFPLGRKMALNAQKMQELAPEMKRIADKYKNDMEKRGQAQRDLFAKHKYNPFSGCLVMFIQMPIFLGLYRGLSCDIALRQAPLIPGVSWCSNLAGPDKFWHWEGFVPEFIASPYGILGLGPYLNILPLITVGLFLLQHKLFTPPPQDEQQQMQHTVMKFMMLFMGILFHKVAAGLCLYLITSTLWGLAERTMLPKPKPVSDMAEKPSKAPSVSSGRNGASTNGASTKKQRRKKNKRR